MYFYNRFFMNCYEQFESKNMTQFIFQINTIYIILFFLPCIKLLYKQNKFKRKQGNYFFTKFTSLETSRLDILQRLYDIIRNTHQYLKYILDDRSWIRASLPVRHGLGRQKNFLYIFSGFSLLCTQLYSTIFFKIWLHK